MVKSELEFYSDQRRQKEIFEKVQKISGDLDIIEKKFKIHLFEEETFISMILNLFN